MESFDTLLAVGGLDDDDAVVGLLIGDRDALAGTVSRAAFLDAVPQFCGLGTVLGGDRATDAIRSLLDLAVEAALRNRITRADQHRRRNFLPRDP